MNINTHRPPGSTNAEARFLSRLSRDLARLLMKAQRHLTYDTLSLPDEEFDRLAAVLVEFGEDIYHDIGLWRGLEQYHQAFFGTPLPLLPPPPDDFSARQEGRLCHLLWVLYSEINSDLILSPTHQDLRHLARVTAEFLAGRCVKKSPPSSVKQFLAQSNRYGWDVKRKLIWLGRHSYLFRYSFQNYIAEHGGQADIDTIDSFICQHTTAWSGLGVIDLLAAVLDISEAQRAELRSWYERHAAYYRLTALKPDHLEAVNLINNQPYTIRMEKPEVHFKAGQVVFGSLIPWRDEWYWSGQQSRLSAVSEQMIRQLRQEFLTKVPQIAYRYLPDRVEQARASLREHYAEFVRSQGDDLIVYPDGLTMAAELQKMYRLRNEALPPDILQAEMNKAGLSTPAPRMPFPRELIDNDNGVGVYFNPAEGQEIMVQFNEVLGGLKKRGINLTEDEEEALRQLLYSPAISPAFVQRLVREYGSESLATAFVIHEPADDTWLAYLLRRYKGHFYRRRYPHLTLIGE